MAASKINRKQVSEDLKSFLNKEMENKENNWENNGKMNSKFDELNTKIETRGRKAEIAETLAKQNQNNISVKLRKINRTGKNTSACRKHWRPGYQKF